MKDPADRRLDVICVGEALVDFLPDGRGARVREVERWTRCSGGSPANVAIGVARLGARAAFLGVVGEDEFGQFLRDSLGREGVDVSALRLTPDAKTGLVFITLDAAGERSFTHFRTRSAELLLSPADVERAPLEDARVVLLTTNSLLYPEAMQAARALVRNAREKGCLTAIDPNIRLSFWEDPQRLKSLLDSLLPKVDVVKLAEDEIAFCVGEADPERAARRLEQLGVALPVVTLGARGALAVWKGALLRVEAPRADVVDGTGAGDGFDAGLLVQLSALLRGGRRFDELSASEIAAAMELGCRVGSKVVAKLGAVAGLPRLADLEA